jgi:hypothetical protein
MSHALQQITCISTKRWNMANPRHDRSNVADAVTALVAGSGRGAMLSLSDSVGTVRFHCPDCEHTDKELASAIASIAISQGKNVVFDLESRLELLPQVNAR